MKTRRTIMTVIALLLLAAGTVKAQQWKELHTGVTEDLYDICCIDTNTIFASGQNGVILKTTDGGETWEEKYRRPRCQITKMCFANSQVGYAFCDSVISRYSHTWSLLKTEDGGETWNQTGMPYTSGFFVFSDDYSVLWNRYVGSEIALKGTDTVFIAISFDGVYRSLNGGVDFEKTTMESFVPSDVRGFHLEDSIGYLLWGNSDYTPSGIAKTEDGGETWYRINTVSDMAHYILFAHFQSNKSIRVFGGFSIEPYGLFSLLDTQDGFETIETGYTQLEVFIFPMEECYRKSCFTDDSNGIAFFVGKDMVDTWDIGYTEDNGSSWTLYPHSNFSFLNARLFDVDGIDTTFYISGENGLVARNRQFTLMDVNEQATPHVGIYPNPMVDKLFVNCKEESNVTVFSTTGQILFDKKLVSDIIDTSKLASGLYLIRVTDGQGKRVTEKVVKK